MSELRHFHADVVKELRGFGGHLECTVCGRTQPLADVEIKLREGRPRCCGYTMRWYTQSDLNARAPGVVVEVLR